MQRSGFVGMLPYLEQGNMYNQMNQSVSGLAAPNLAYTQVPLPALLCPSDTDSNRIQLGTDGAGSLLVAPADYAFSAGDYSNGTTGTGANGGGNDMPYANNVTGNGRGMFSRYYFTTRIRDVTDGTSNTIALGECVGAWCGWQMGWGFQSFATTAYPINWNNAALRILPNGYMDPTTCIGFRSQHSGGAHFLLADGAVRFINQNISGITYNALESRAGGEVIGDY